MLNRALIGPLIAAVLCGLTSAAPAQNSPPVLEPIGNKTVDEGSLLAFTATALDPTGSTLTFSLEPPVPVGASLTSAGAFSWTPAEAQGPAFYVITVRVTRDSDGASDQETIQVTVNEVNLAPVLATIGNKSICEGVALQFTAAAIDPDIPLNTLTYSLTLGSPPATGAAINASTGVFSWVPNEAQGPGVYPITVCVTDNGNPPLQDCETFTITVPECDTAPVLNPIGNKTVSEGSTLTFTATASDSDIPAQTLSFSMTFGSPPATGATINSTTGAFFWTPTEAQGGAIYPITVTVSDNSSPALSDSETIQVTVLEACAPIVLSPIGNRTVDEGSTLAFTAVATDPNIPSSGITYSLNVGSPAASGATINASTGAFSWTPNEGQGPGIYPLTITASVGGSCPSTDFEAIQITVNEVNQPPVIAPIGDKSLIEGSILTFAVTATDPDIPVNMLRCFLPPGAPIGASLDPTNCIFTFASTECQGPGVLSITVCVIDNGSPPLTTCLTFSITVLEVNAAPTLAPIGNKTVVEGELLTFTATASDPDCPSNTFIFSLEGAPPGATIQLFTGVFTWTPTEDQGPAVYTITVRVTDNGSPSLSDSEAIQVTVLEDNSGPTADANGPYPGVVGFPVSFDGSGSFDPDGDPLAFLWDFGDGIGSTAMNPVHVYTAAGLYAVTLRVTDPEGLFSDDATTASIEPFFTTGVFFVGGNRTTRLMSERAFTCAQLEPVGGAYSNADVDLTSIRMVYGGSSIPAISEKTVIDADRDHDGVLEIAACFSKDNLRILFADLPPGENLVEVRIEGSLVGGATFQGSAVHRVIASGGSLAASVTPQPLTSEGVVTFRTLKEGRVAVQLFDLRGRLIRALRETSVAAGYHHVKFDGRDAQGRKLASGIYYVRVHSSAEGTETRRVTIVR